jgi:hypothetical protein
MNQLSIGPFPNVSVLYRGASVASCIVTDLYEYMMATLVDWLAWLALSQFV